MPGRDRLPGGSKNLWTAADPAANGSTPGTGAERRARARRTDPRLEHRDDRICEVIHVLRADARDVHTARVHHVDAEFLAEALHLRLVEAEQREKAPLLDRKSTRLNSSHVKT